MGSLSYMTTAAMAGGLKQKAKDSGSGQFVLADGQANGYNVTREFYYNDAGAQINNLALSVQSRVKGLTPEDESWPEDGYRGDYIVDVANAYLAGETVVADDREVTAKADPEDRDAIREFAVAYLRREQDLDLKAFGVQFDVYFLESSLYEDGKVEATVERLKANGYNITDWDHYLLDPHPLPEKGWYFIGHTDEGRWHFFKHLSTLPAPTMHIRIFSGETHFEMLHRLARDMKLDEKRIENLYDKLSRYKEADIFAGDYTVAKEADDQIGLQGIEPLIRRFVEPVPSMTGSPAVSGRSEHAKLFRTRVGPGTVAGGVGTKSRRAPFVTHVANEQLVGGESFMEGGFEMTIVHHARSEAAA
jgi:hypothetical protein